MDVKFSYRPGMESKRLSFSAPARKWRKGWIPVRIRSWWIELASDTTYGFVCRKHDRKTVGAKDASSYGKSDWTFLSCLCGAVEKPIGKTLGTVLYDDVCDCR
jgi:hypothetical protein